MKKVAVIGCGAYMESGYGCPGEWRCLKAAALGDHKFDEASQVVSFIKCECPGRALVPTVGMSMKLSEVKPDKIYLSSCLVNAKPPANSRSDLQWALPYPGQYSASEQVVFLPMVEHVSVVQKTMHTERLVRLVPMWREHDGYRQRPDNASGAADGECERKITHVPEHPAQDREKDVPYAIRGKHQGIVGSD